MLCNVVIIKYLLLYNNYKWNINRLKLCIYTVTYIITILYINYTSNLKSYGKYEGKLLKKQIWSNVDYLAI